MTSAYVFDSSSLILLAKVTLLRNFAEERKIMMTTTVTAEATSNLKFDDAKIISNLIEDGLIQQISDRLQVSKFSADFGIGKGEAEALSLAFKDKYILATDDSKAIKACKILNVKFVTAIHCLIHLYRRDKLDKKFALEKLKSLERYGRYTVDIIKDARRILEGDKNG